MREVNVEMIACSHSCAIRQTEHLTLRHCANERDMVEAFELVKIVMQMKTCRLYDKVDCLVYPDILLIDLVRYPKLVMNQSRIGYLSRRSL